MGKKQMFNKLLSAFGFNIVSINELYKLKEDKANTRHFIDGLLSFFLTVKGPPLKVCQIGAYDGVSGDPIYNFLMENKENIDALLIEPQKKPFYDCMNNYSDNPNVRFLNVAISPEPSKKLTLYISSNAKQGGGSGTTPERERRVLLNAKKLGVSEEESSACLNSFTIDCMILKEAMFKSDFGGNLDFLQVDCEGYDDQVLYASDLESLLPAAINYEFRHLSPERYNRLSKWLDSLGYIRFRWNKRDECAISSSNKKYSFNINT